MTSSTESLPQRMWNGPLTKYFVGLGVSLTGAGVIGSVVWLRAHEAQAAHPVAAEKIAHINGDINELSQQVDEIQDGQIQQTILLNKIAVKVGADSE